MSSKPWKDWSPGVLCKDQIIDLSKESFIEHLIKEDMDGSSFDLHLTDEGYELLNGTIKPCGARYHQYLIDDKLVKRLAPEDGVFNLKPGHGYVFKINERLHFGEGHNFYGQATARSSIGRVDVLARLIVDGMKSYEGFNPGCISGDLFVEIIPNTFKVKVKEGISVSQLRLFLGNPSISEIKINKKSDFNWLISKESDCVDSLCVDLAPIKIGSENASAFRGAEDENSDPIDLWKNIIESERPSPEKYWKKEVENNERLVIEKDKFYILRSEERISLPGGIAVYCRAIDEAIGEMRIHYAGFVHPWFGKKRIDDKKGTPLIFEVRGHSIDVNLKQGERLAHLIYYRMSKEAEEPKPEDLEKDEYKDQELKLSSFFGKWS